MNTVSSENQRPDRRAGSTPSGLRMWLKAIDAALSALEAAVWRIRAEATESWNTARRHWGAAVLEVVGLSRSVGDWQDRAARLTSAGWTLTKIASSYRLHITRAAFMRKHTAADALQRLHQKNATRFLELCLEQGGGFLKAGQALSARPDLLPAAWVERLSTLQDEVPGLSLDEIMPIVESELGDTGERFLSFDSTPIGAASIGQVHRAVLLDGTEVAIKVRRPGIETLIELDMELLGLFIDGLRSSLPEADYETSIAEIQTMIRGELDYSAERIHGQTIAQHVQGHETLRVPATIDDLCTERVLTTELVRGEKITLVLDRLAAQGALGDEQAHARISKILSTVIESYVGQILELGRFQADPHPGNFLIDQDDQVVLLDFGCTKVLEDEVRRSYAEIMQAFMVRDRKGVAERLALLGFRTKTGAPDTLLLFADLLLQELQEHLSAEQEPQWPTTEELVARLGELMRAMEDDPVILIPDHFVMIGRVLTTLGGMFLHYRPTFDARRSLLPVIARALGS